MDRRLYNYLRIKSALLRTPPIRISNYNVNGVSDAASKWLKGTNNAAKWSAEDLAALGVGGLATVGSIGLVHSIMETNRRQKEMYDKMMSAKNKNKNKNVI